MGLLEKWEIEPKEVNEILEERASLRGMFFGYVNEYKLRTLWRNDPRLADIRRHNNHDRGKKGDLSVVYKGIVIAVEVKSLQTHSVKYEDGYYTGTFQCDASDKREVNLPTGRTINTTCLLVGEFDMLAVGLFAFGDNWRFAFAKNKDLPRSKYYGYAEEDRKHLIKSSMKISLPLELPFHSEPFALLDEIITEKSKRKPKRKRRKKV